jgi:hypothetical protein
MLLVKSNIFGTMSNTQNMQQTNLCLNKSYIIIEFSLKPSRDPTSDHPRPWFGCDLRLGTTALCSPLPSFSCHPSTKVQTYATTLQLASTELPATVLRNPNMPRCGDCVDVKWIPQVGRSCNSAKHQGIFSEFILINDRCFFCQDWMLLLLGQPM